MNVLEYGVACGQCGKRLGWATDVINGTNHTMSHVVTCMDCLPERLARAEIEGAPAETLARARKFLEETA